MTTRAGRVHSPNAVVGVGVMTVSFLGTHAPRTRHIAMAVTLI